MGDSVGAIRTSTGTPTGSGGVELAPVTEASGVTISRRKHLRRKHTQECLSNPTWWDELFRLIAAGARVDDVARVTEVPWHQVRNQLDAQPELEARYQAAKRAKADRFASKVDEISERLEDINPSIALRGYMWLAQVTNPEEYADRKNIKVEKTVRSQHVLELRALAKGETVKDVTPKGDPAPLLTDAPK